MLYKEFSPTEFDGHLEVEDREDWIVAPVAQNRDSDPLARSNFECLLRDLGGESDTLEVHRFGHWANGWFEIILVHPSREKDVEDWERALEDYPVVDEEHFSELEHNEALEVWQNCYNWEERIEYIRENKSQFDFDNLMDMVECVKGVYFNGYASELIG